MRRKILINRLCQALAGVLLPLALQAGPAGHQVSARMEERMYLLENKGQLKDEHGRIRRDIDFVLSGSNGVQVFIAGDGIRYQWKRNVAEQELETYRMDVKLQGAARPSAVHAEEPAAYFERYYVQGAGAAHARSWQKVVYKDVYPFIDWVVYVRDGHLEYDFRVRPGGRVSDIKLKYNGSAALKIGRDGSLLATTPMGTVRENKPFTFQEDGRTVSSAFVLEGDLLSFRTGKYDPGTTLIIDPVLEWATYFGGTGSDLGRAVAVDNLGAVYMAGSTAGGSNLVTASAHQVTYGGASEDAFLAKYDSSGVKLWATYFGGSGADGAWSVTCDANNYVYVTGHTASTSGIAAGNSYQSVKAAGQDAFLARFTPAGVIEWATYYGGSGEDEGWGVSCDPYGNVFIGGRTTSPAGIASAGTHQTTFSAGTDAFVAKFDIAGNFKWGTYIGGRLNDLTSGIACDLSGNVYIAGETGSDTGIASPNGHQNFIVAGNGSEAFIVKIDSAGARLWGSYYGGNQSGQTFGQGLAVDAANDVYLVGYTTSGIGIATAGSHQPLSPGGYSAYLVKFDGFGNRYWGTYFGGSNQENGYGVACDPWGGVYVTGYTTSTDSIATEGAIQSVYRGGNDIFIAKFDRDGVRHWGTYYGGPAYDAGWSVAADAFGNVYTAAFAASAGIGTPRASQQISGGGFDAFLIRISDCAPLGAPGPLAGAPEICSGKSSLFSIAPVSGARSYRWTLPAGWIGVSTADSIRVIAPEGSSGTLRVTAVGTCSESQPSELEIDVLPVPDVGILVEGDMLGASRTFVSYQWYINDMKMDGATDSAYKVFMNATYALEVIDEKGCSAMSSPYKVNNVSVADPGMDVKLEVFPNPASGIIYIRSEILVQGSLHSMDGKQLMQWSGQDRVDIGGLAPGIYFIRFTDESGKPVRTERIVRQGTR